MILSFKLYKKSPRFYSEYLLVNKRGEFNNNWKETKFAIIQIAHWEKSLFIVKTYFQQ